MLSLFHRIGNNLALSLQSATELHVFVHGGGSSGEPFDLGAAPVLFHLQNDPELFEYINGCENNLDNLDYGAVRRSLSPSHPKAKTEQMRCDHRVKVTD